MRFIKTLHATLFYGFPNGEGEAQTPGDFSFYAARAGFLTKNHARSA